MTPSHSLRSLVVTIGMCAALVGGAALAGASISRPRSISSESPTKILSTSIAAADAQKSVRVSCHSAIPSFGLTGTVVTNLGVSHGTQTETVKATGLGTATGSVRYVNGVVYFNGNAAFLLYQFNVKNSKYANEWISVKPGQKDYSAIADGMYMASLRGQLAPSGTLTKATVTYGGHAAIEITGNASATQNDGTGKVHLYVSAQSPYLPLSETSATKIDSANQTGTCTLSKWKLSVTATAPANPTPITKTNL